MTHFAKCEPTSNSTLFTVSQVIVAEQDFVNTQPGLWKQTSYNTIGGKHTQGGTPLRGNYAGIGYTYDATHDAFYAPQPYPSWVLNTSTFLWEAPTPMPADGGQYTWDEATKSWVPVTTLKTV
jgi:hypothetical protein